MTRSGFIRSVAWVTQFILVASLLMWPVTVQADQAQYSYDELGRLVGVIDGQGNVAVYNYDSVGNLTSIQRFTSSGGGSTGNIGIFFFTPSSGPVTTQVTIKGFGFSSTPSANVVKFNGTTATVTAATANSITTTVPIGATTGPITVTNSNGTGTSAQPFTVLVPPIITGVEPNRVPRGNTTEIIIGGFNLASATAVTFTQSGMTAIIQAGATAQSLLISLTVGPTVLVGSYTFSVTTPGGIAQSGTVMVSVALAQPGFGVTKGSVFLPQPAQVAPSGSSMVVAPRGSVSMP